MLDNFQNEFLQAILTGPSTESLKSYLRDSDRITKDQSIDVYRNDYSARMQEALGKNYEASWILLGDEEFLGLTKKYIQLYPSIFRNLSSYGHLFPDFLVQEEIDSEIVTMARFERNFWQLFNQNSNPSQIIESDKISELIFEVSDSVSLFHTSYKMHELWQVREENNTNLSFDEYEGDQYLAVYKGFEKVIIKEINSDQFIILNHLSEVKSLNVLFVTLEKLNVFPSEKDWAGVFEVLSYCKRTINIGKVNI